MGIPCIPGGGMTAEMRCNIIERYKPTILATLPSQLLRLRRVMQGLGLDPARSSIKTLFTGGEPAAGISTTRARIEVRCEVEIIAPDTLPKTEFKAKRIFDNRNKR